MPVPSDAITPVSDVPTSRPDTRLYGRSLMAVRVVWLALAALFVATFAFSVPISFALSEQVCSGDNCSDPHLTPQDIRTLAHAGLSPVFFASYFTVLSIVFVLVWVVMGALIFWRKSDESRTLFFAFFLVTFGTIWLADPGSTLAVANPAWHVPAALIDFFSQSFVISFAYVFPNGRFVPRWTRWLALALILANVPGYLYPGSAVDVNAGSGLLDPIFTLTLFGSSIFAQIYRYRRRSTPVERQQTKWVMLALVAALLIYASAVFIPTNSSLFFKFIGATLLELALLLIPVAIAIGILRYRLWDVDNLINKVLVYGLLTGLLGALYIGLILGLESLAEAITGTGNQPIALVVSTLIIAALFQPVRHRLQRLIDKRFYRMKYDAQEALDAFSATLRQEVDSNELREQLLAVVNETMQPAHVSLWLRQPERNAADLAYRLEPHGGAHANSDPD